MKEFLQSFATNIANSNYPLIGLSAIAFAESSFFPIPPDTILIPLALTNSRLSLFYAFLTTIFSVLGGIFGYFIGHKGGKPVVNKFISDEKLYKVKLYYQKYDVWAIFLAAFTPIPYKIFTIAAGLFDLNIKKFIIASIIGRGGRFFLVSGLIFIFGPQIKYFLTNYFEFFIIIFTIVLIGGFLTINYLFKKKV